MPDSPRVAGAPDTWTLPGHKLYPLRDVDYEQAALNLEARHRRSAADSAAGMADDWQIRHVFDAAERLIADGHFRFDMYGFRRAVFSGAELPFFLRLCLRDEPALTNDAAKALLTPENRRAVALAVAECCGYDVAHLRKKEAPEKNAGAGPAPDQPPASSSPNNSAAPSTTTSSPPTPTP